VTGPVLRPISAYVGRASLLERVSSALRRATCRVIGHAPAVARVAEGGRPKKKITLPLDV